MVGKWCALNSLIEAGALLPEQGLLLTGVRIICVHEWVTVTREYRMGLVPLIGLWTPPPVVVVDEREECKRCGKVRGERSLAEEDKGK